MKRGLVLLLAVVFLIGAYLYATGRVAWKSSTGKPRSDQNAVQQQLIALARSRGAEANWRRGLGSRQPNDTVYTIEIERALLAAPDQRFVFRGSVEDVVPLPNGRFRVLLQPSLSRSRLKTPGVSPGMKAFPAGGWAGAAGPDF